MKRKGFRVFLASLLFMSTIAVSGCALGQNTTIFITTTQLTTKPNPITVKEIVTKTVNGQPASTTITVTNYVTTTTTVPMVTSSPPPPSTVYLTTTVFQEGIAVRQLILPAEEMLATTDFNICLEVQNVSAGDMECNIPIIITHQEEDDYELVQHVDFFIESGETKTICTDDMKLPLGSYFVEAGEILREFYIVEGGG